MAAAVMQYPNFAIFLADNDQWATGDLRSKERPGGRNLAFVTDITPGSRKNPFAFEREDCRIGINAPVDPVRLNQCTNLGRGNHLSDLTRCSTAGGIVSPSKAAVAVFR